MQPPVIRAREFHADRAWGVLDIAPIEGASVRLQAGDMFYARVGCEHVARPLGEARILVVEKAGSM